MKMLELLRSHFVGTAIAVVLLTSVGRFLVQGYRIRRRMRNLPGPPHSWIWGHLKIMGDEMADIPPRCHPHVVPLRIQKKYNLPRYFYMDLWPAGDPALYVFDPQLSESLTVDHPTPKHYGLVPFMIHLAGPGDLVSSNGAYWKKWRSIMNPGFASGHLMTLVPGIVDDSIVFTEKMSEHAAKGEVFRLEEDATRLTVDIIGKVALDMQLGTQRGENEMVTAFREQVHLVPNEGPQDVLKMWYPSGIYRRWRNQKIMNDYIGKVLDKRFARQDSTKANGSTGGKKQRKRAIIDLALEAYREQEKSATSTGIDDEFKRSAITQIRTFIFAGHDTTSSTIAYAIYMLHKNPACLAKLRKEHDDLLGSVEDTPQKIKDDPVILNRLEYTMAVIRETLRLWPAASATRTGDPNYVHQDPVTGEPLETQDLLVWIIHYAQHRSPEIWGDTADVFDPSRFLPENIQYLPENNPWRAFERGSRNCIGQELALIESRIILALVARQFEFQPAFDSLDELKNDGSFWTKDDRFTRGKVLDLDGEVCYPVLIGTAKPNQGLPVRVKQLV